MGHRLTQNDNNAAAAGLVGCWEKEERGGYVRGILALTSGRKRSA